MMFLLHVLVGMGTVPGKGYSTDNYESVLHFVQSVSLSAYG